MVDFDALDEDTADALLWLHYKIKRDGIEGIHYMRTARKRLERDADDIVADNIKRELQS